MVLSRPLHIVLYIQMYLSINKNVVGNSALNTRMYVTQNLYGHQQSIGIDE